MRRYESVWVVNGDLPDEEVKSAIDKFSRIISSADGLLVGLDDWGRRKLAYKIKGTHRGYYVLADYAGTPATVKELERNYRIDDRIVRYHTVKKSDQVDLEALQAEIAARAQAAQPEPEVAPAPEPEPAPAAAEAASTPEVTPEAAAASPEEAAAPEQTPAPAKEE
ncbi:MAG: 30S ribosomal protein S6 [Syntrophales bacterium]|nr:30S ribosomal protein S6 [Syntrophales bacterium]